MDDPRCGLLQSASGFAGMTNIQQDGERQATG